MREFIRNRPVFAWALYDWANSAFACTVMAGFFPVFFREFWSLGVDPTETTERLGFANAAAGLVVALLAPILGAVGQLQFEVVAFRLQDEYAVASVFDTIAVHTARWIYSDDEKHLEEFRTKAYDHLAIDHSGALVYLAPSRVNLELTIERCRERKAGSSASNTPKTRTRASRAVCAATRNRSGVDSSSRWALASCAGVRVPIA